MIRKRLVFAVSTVMVSGMLGACAGSPYANNAPYGVLAGQAGGGVLQDAAVGAALPAIINSLPGVLNPQGAGAAGVVSQQGTVLSVQTIQGQGMAQSPLGGLAGAALGGLGNGNGDLTSIATAVAAAALQNGNGNVNVGGQTSYRVTVRLDSGQVQTFDMAHYPNLRDGDRVRISNGQIYR